MKYYFLIGVWLCYAALHSMEASESLKIIQLNSSLYKEQLNNFFDSRRDLLPPEWEVEIPTCLDAINSHFARGTVDDFKNTLNEAKTYLNSINTKLTELPTLKDNLSAQTSAQEAYKTLLNSIWISFYDNKKSDIEENSAPSSLKKLFCCGKRETEPLLDPQSQKLKIFKEIFLNNK